MKQRKKQPILTRQAILQAAGRSFAHQGYAATGIGSIVADSGLTKGALFYDFLDKRSPVDAWINESLTAEMVKLWYLPLSSVGRAAAESRTLKPKHRFCAV